MRKSVPVKESLRWIVALNGLSSMLPSTSRVAFGMQDVVGIHRLMSGCVTDDPHFQHIIRSRWQGNRGIGLVCATG